jgi:hypothetical protein
MPKIQVSVPHRLSQEEAKARISKLIAESRTKFGGQVSDLREAWKGNVDEFSFSAMGFTVDGRLDVQPAEVKIDVNLPWAALPFKGKVETEISKHARELLA